MLLILASEAASNAAEALEILNAKKSPVDNKYYASLDENGAGVGAEITGANDTNTIEGLEATAEHQLQALNSAKGTNANKQADYATAIAEYNAAKQKAEQSASDVSTKGAALEGARNAAVDAYNAQQDLDEADKIEYDDVDWDSMAAGDFKDWYDALNATDSVKKSVTDAKAEYDSAVSTNAADESDANSKQSAIAGKKTAADSSAADVAHAQSDYDTAVDNVNTAKEDAKAAKNTVDNADAVLSSKAAEAVAAQDAFTNAQAADNAAGEALAEATQAKTDAETAANNAQQAVNDAQEAVNTAAQQKTAMEAIQAEYGTEDSGN